MKEYEFHEIANLFPLMNKDKLSELREDIKTNGLLEPIVLFEGKILDGRNRYLVCKELGIETKTKDYSNKIDPLDYVIAENLHRRQLSGAEMAEVAWKASDWLQEKAKENEKKGGRPVKNGLSSEDKPIKGTQKPLGIESITSKEGLRFEKEDINKNSEKPIGRDQRSNHKEHLNNIKNEKIISSEYNNINDPPKRTEETIKREGPVHVRKDLAKKFHVSEETLSVAQKVKELNDPNINKKWEHAKKGSTTINAVRMAINKRNKPKEVPKLPEDKYNIIYADPPWFYKEGNITPNRIIENQYPSMKTEEICKLKIPTTDNSILFLWVTSPKLEEGLQVIKAWNFEYKTSMVWVKDKIGMGYYVRGRHELLLIATKGNPSKPEPRDRHDSVIEAPRTEHSKKPRIMYEIIEKMYPDGKYLELFARNIRDKWKSWGNEI